MSWPRRSGAAVLAGVLTAGAVPAAAQDPVPDPPAGAVASRDGRDAAGPAARAPGLPAWLLPPVETPIADSIDAAVEKYVREHFAPCGTEAVPCFPVTLQVEGRQYSVREALDNMQLDNRPVPGAPPTAAEMIQYGANPRPTSASVGFDPKAVVCKTRQILQKIQGRSRRYYLYRVWDEAGERAVLRDRPLNPEEFAADPQFRYESLGEFGDECQAIKAYRSRMHELRMPRDAGTAEIGVSSEPQSP